MRKCLLNIFTITVLCLFSIINTSTFSGNKLEISFVGDIFLQKQILNSYYDYSKKFYDFKDEILEDIKLDIQKDISAVVLDTVVAGNIFPPSSYPLYNAPSEILYFLRKSGFNLVITSVNHALDKGEKGVYETIINLKKNGFYHIGTNLTPEREDKILIIRKNKFNIGFLAYTYSTNGIFPPKSREYLVNYLNESEIKKDIKALKDSVDIIIVYLHWGDEYKELPNDFQRNLAKKIIDWGADIIVGSHPHTVSICEKINGKYCFYSLGNFFADQYGLKISKVKFGLILNLTLFKSFNRIEIQKIKLIPVYILREKVKEKYRYKIVKAKNLLNYNKEDKLYYNKLLKMLKEKGNQEIIIE